MDLSKVPGKCMASFIVAVNWIYFILTGVLMGVVFGIVLAYFGERNGQIDDNDERFGYVDTNYLRSRRNIVLFMVGAIIAIYLMVQGFLNILLTRGVREGNIRKLTTWIYLNIVLCILWSTYKGYTIFIEQEESTKMGGYIFGLVWTIGSIFFIRAYRDNVAMIRRANEASSSPDFEKNPNIKV